MDKELLQSIFSAPYDDVSWRNVLTTIFKARKLFEAPQRITISDNPCISAAYELGSITTADERLIGIYKVDVNPTVWLERNKVGLRESLRSVYKYDVDGALIVFVQEGKWRFSFVSEIRDSAGIRKTEPKRYTYLFGSGESCRTAAERFLKLTNKPLLLAGLFEAFSVEKLTNDFFKSYKGFFESFCLFLYSTSQYKQLFVGDNAPTKGDWKKPEAKPIRDFCKILLGRLVFLQFLQKKGWMGVKATTNTWVGGNKRFLQELFETTTHKQHFHSKVLRVLFFETLNTKREGDIAPVILGQGIKIPYLNGGLFERDLPFNSTIDFPVNLFADLLTFFEQYNFTIEEDDPLDREVGIDPEMLGHIFENLLEENREKGAFYTPKEIVHYMCKSSLIEYLHKQFPAENLSDIEKLVISHIVPETFTDFRKANLLNQKLCAVKICDPAIGSGAFPMGMLHEILDCRRIIYGYMQTATPFNPNVVKKEIIQQNLYGVDSDQGAVEIARLRFWLALVVDEFDPQPLPNLDYKIMQGNSLLEQYAGLNLTDLINADDSLLVAAKKQLTLGKEFEAPLLQVSIFDSITKEKLIELLQKYYDPDSWEKSNGAAIDKLKLRRQIEDIVEGKIHAYIVQTRNRKEAEIYQFESKWKINGKFNINKLQQGSKEYKKYSTLIKEREQLSATEEKLISLQKEQNKPYFLWHLWFKEVFDLGGFDIVIGNPPYIQLQSLGGDADILQGAGFKTFKRTGDVYCLFYELGNKIIKPGGCLIFITGSAWLRSDYGELLRKYLTENTNPIKLIDLSDSDIFQSATVLTTILQFTRENYKGSLKATRLTRKDRGVVSRLHQWFNENSVLLSELGSRNWSVATKQKIEIKEEVLKKGIPLKEWGIEINYGLKTGLNEAFVIDEAKKNQLISEDPHSADIIKPLLRGRDIGRYQLNFQDQYLICTHNGVKEKNIPRIKALENYPAIASHLELFRKALIARADQGDHWSNLRSCAYIMEFENPKIIYPNMVKIISFAYDDKGYYANQKCFIITGEKLKYLLGILNSRLFRFCFEDDFPELQGNSREINKVVFENIPIYYPDDNLELVCSNLVSYILYLYNDESKALFTHTANKNIATTIENILDMAVYEIYFSNHMKDQGITVLEYLRPKLQSTLVNQEIIKNFYLWFQQPDNPVRNHIMLTDIRSPNLLSQINLGKL